MILLTMMTAFQGTELDEDIQKGRFIPAGEKEILMEEKVFLENLELPDTYFGAAHSLDSVRIEGILRDEKEEMIATLERGIERVDESAFNRTSRRGTL